GHRHTCVRHRSGGASCWGDNDRGQLADETTTDWPMPRRAVLLDGMDIAEIDAGGSHTCARLETGSIVCVGEDRDDQLGDGPDDAPAATLVTVTGITDARAIAMGAAHGCALLASGEVACWGNN